MATPLHIYHWFLNLKYNTKRDATILPWIILFLVLKVSKEKYFSTADIVIRNNSTAGKNKDFGNRQTQIKKLIPNIYKL